MKPSAVENPGKISAVKKIREELESSSFSDEESDSTDACIFYNEMMAETSGTKNIKFVLYLHYYFLMNAPYIFIPLLFSPGAGE